jgi:uncharacterized RDD family membrane protein YckC
MTASGSPRDDPTGLEQEAIWESAPDTEGTLSATPDEPAVPGASRSSRGLTESITSTEQTPGPAGLYYADVPNRIMALVIDIIVLSVFGFILALLLGGLVTAPGALDSPGGQLDVVAFLILVLFQAGLSFAYFGYFWTATRATLGMRLLGLQIGDESDGHAIGWRQALIRWLLLGTPSMLASLAAYVPDMIAVVLSLLGLGWLFLLLYTMAQSPTKQGLQDRYAHTILIRVRRRST